MKNIRTISMLLILLICLFLLNKSQAVPSFDADSNLQVLHFRIDSMTLIGHWEHPAIILLQEGFEDSSELPAGWQSLSEENPGWIRTDSGTSMNFLVNNHGQFMLSNDFNAGQTHNGCCDRLITPPLNLSLTDSAIITFESCFSGTFNEKARLEISLDGGQSWQQVLTLEPPEYFYGQWTKVSADLTAFSGMPGSESTLICFHADDSGQQASGWAVDDILVKALATGVQGYSLWLDDSYAGSTTGQTWQFEQAGLPLCSLHEAKIAVTYGNGTSLSDSVTFNNWYLPYPDSITCDAVSSQLYFSWTPPDFSNSNMEDHFVFYRLYVNDALEALIAPGTTSYTIQIPESGEYCLKLVAVYDLTALGFPGTFYESYPAGPVCYNLIYCCILPFCEDWSSGSFSLNSWSQGSHWVVSEDEGTMPPAAQFSSQPVINDYSESLVMFPRLAPGNTATPHDVFLEFDLKLEDNQANQTEKLGFYWKVQGGEWDTITEFSNGGSFDWTHFIFRLGAPYQLHVICFRVVAWGENSGNMDSWLLDNLCLYTRWGINAPLELTASPGLQNVALEWKTPSDSLVFKSGTGATDLLGYSVFRRSRNPVLSEWNEIGTTTCTWFDDTNLVLNCYDYYVQANYNEGAAVSNIDSLNCPEVGIPVTNTEPFRVIYDGASGWVEIINMASVTNIRLYDAFGRFLKDYPGSGTEKQWLNVSDLPAGSYFITLTEKRKSLATLKLIIPSRQ